MGSFHARLAPLVGTGAFARSGVMVWSQLDFLHFLTIIAVLKPWQEMLSTVIVLISVGVYVDLTVSRGSFVCVRVLSCTYFVACTSFVLPFVLPFVGY